MNARVGKVLKSVVRWTIAAVGTWYVLSQLSWNDRALVRLEGNPTPRWATVIQGDEHSPQLIIQTWDDHQTHTIDAASVATEPVSKNSHVPKPRIQVGVRHLLASARHWYLFASLGIFPLTFLITSFRWHELLKALDIRLTWQRTFVLNMVGAFYNTFMLGSVGGDVLKMYYVAKQTHHRTRAVMSVAVDRIIGLLALIILGGSVAAYTAWHLKIGQTQEVAMACAVIIFLTAVGLTIFYNPTLHRLIGLDWMLRKLPMRERVGRVVETMRLYGKRPGLAAAALLVSFPVHIVVIFSAFLAGVAFNLHIPWQYYWTVVPVTVLAGSIPISPQGAGVMEYFAILLLTPVGCTVAEAVVLTMSIRLVQVLWNLVGGLFVLRGGYHKPTAAQEREIEAEDEDGPALGRSAATENGR
jgi:uncharacterized protein (TIRG00374 family)